MSLLVGIVAHRKALAQQDAVVHLERRQRRQVQEDVAAHQKAIAQQDVIAVIK